MCIGGTNEEISIFYNEICNIYNEKMQSHKEIGNFIVKNLNQNSLLEQVPILILNNSQQFILRRTWVYYVIK